MIKVGIVENLRILKLEKSDKGSLNITIAPAGDTEVATPSAPAAQPAGIEAIFGELNNTSEGSALTNQLTYIHWPYKIDEYTKTAEDVLKAINSSKEFLNHILKQYMTEDKIQWSIMDGVAIDRSSQAAAMQGMVVPANIAKIYDNQVNGFIRMLAPHIGPNSPLFRFKLTRQSKLKHYATLPKFAPFMEPMSIPAAQSKLAYSRWEIEKKYNDGTPVAEAETKTDQPSPAESQAAAGIFGN